jgi:hypothetical protein
VRQRKLVCSDPRIKGKLAIRRRTAGAGAGGGCNRVQAVPVGSRAQHDATARVPDCPLAPSGAASPVAAASLACGRGLAGGWSRAGALFTRNAASHQKTEAHRSDPPGASPTRPDRVSVVVRAPREEQPSCAVNGSIIYTPSSRMSGGVTEVMPMQMREGSRGGTDLGEVGKVSTLRADLDRAVS